MKKFIKILPILILFSSASLAQTPQTSYVLPTINAMKGYTGKANRVYVIEKNQDYVPCNTCVVNDQTVFQGSNGTKWGKVTDSSVVSMISNKDTSSYHTATQIDSAIYSLNRPNGSKTIFILEADTTGNGGTASGVQSVTGLNTDNTDPANPIVKISVDGTTITGDGTPANPLISHASGETTHANNGLSLSGDTVQLGGVLNKNTTIDFGSYNLQINGNLSSGPLVKVNNSGTGFAGEFFGFYPLHGQTSNGVGINADASGTGTGLSATSFSGRATEFKIYPDLNNSIRTVSTFIRRTLAGGGATSGFGLSLDMILETTIAPQFSNSITSEWTDPTSATRTSQLLFTGVYNAVNKDLLSLNGNGSIKFNNYGQNLFTGTLAKSLGVDASGNVIEYDASSGGGTTYTASNGLTLVGTDFQLGGLLTSNTVIAGGNSHTLSVTGNHGANLFSAVQSGDGAAISGWAQGTGVGIVGQGGSAGVQGISDGIFGAVSAQTTSGIGFYANLLGSTNGTIQTAIKIARNTPGTATNGVGSSIEFWTNSTTTLQKANEVISKWVDATDATRSSQFSITGVGGGTPNTLLTLNGNGSIQLNKYGTGIFSGTLAKTLGIDASGNIIEYNASAGSSFGVTTMTEGAANAPNRNSINSYTAASPITNYEIQLPKISIIPSLVNGDRIELKFDQDVTNLSFTVGTAYYVPSTITKGTYILLIYNASDDTWY